MHWLLVAAFAVDPPILTAPYRWECSPPLVAPERKRADPCISVKDPTVVFADGRWHVFATIRSEKRSHNVEYLSFADWSQANEAKRHLLKLRDGYYCAPQVFWHTPHKKWYLIVQATFPGRKPEFQPAFSTSDNVGDPDSWTPAKPMILRDLPGQKWIDFWVICDATHARMFFTSNDGRMWRSDANLTEFPHGWSKPEVVIKDDIFEASHIYKVKGRDEYLCLIEAIHDHRRYYKSYTAKTLDGTWNPHATTWANPFAGRANVTFPAGDRWTDHISHGELLRAGVDEKLEVDPADGRFLIQGVADADFRGKPYGKIPWRLGLLKLANPRPSP